MSKTTVKSRFRLCTIILEFNNPQMTLDTLQSLKKAILPDNIDHHIVIIDNSPVPDGSLKRKISRFKNVELITTLQNTGFAAGNNLGIKKGLKKSYDLFLLLNNDVLVHPGFLKQLINSLKTGADMVVPKIYFAPGFEYHRKRYKKSQLGKVLWYAGGYFDWKNVFGRHLGVDEVDIGQYDQPKIIDFANFCCILIKREVFDTIGFLDPQYFLYWEDADFSQRARLAGFTQYYQPKAVIWHKSSGSSGSGSTLHDYYLTRNRLIFGFKYAPFRTKLALLRQSLKLLFTGRPGERKGITDFYLLKRGKGELA